MSDWITEKSTATRKEGEGKERRVRLSERRDGRRYLNRETKGDDGGGKEGELRKNCFHWRPFVGEMWLGKSEIPRYV